MNLLSKNVELRVVKAPVAAASNTDSNTAIIDMAGYTGVLFAAVVADSVATGVATLTVEQNTANQDAGMTALVGANAVATCVVTDDINDKLLVVDVSRPRERFVQAVVKSATANIAFGHVFAILYKGRKAPVLQGATILALSAVAGPNEV